MLSSLHHSLEGSAAVTRDRFAQLASTDAPRPAANATRLRVVLVLPTYLPESFGGAEQQSRKLALALSRLGVQVTLLAPRLRYRTAKAEQDGPISLRRFRVSKPPNLGGRYLGSFLWWSVKLFWWLLRNRKRYDVIHIVHGRLHAVPAVIAGALLQKPTLIKIGRGGKDHFDLDLVSSKRIVGPWYVKALVRHATGYVANSRVIVEDLLRWRIASGRIHEIPNGVELPPITERMGDRGAVNFIYLGRLDPEKSLDLMIKGFARVHADSRALLTIVGDGSCRRELENLVRDLGLQHRVRFTGAVIDTAAELRRADVYVSCSVSEGMSNALLEAMSFGLMPLVSLVSGVADIVEPNRTGLLFAPNNLEAFVARLHAVLAMSPESRRTLGMQARATIESRFGIDQIAEQHVALYRELTS